MEMPLLKLDCDFLLVSKTATGNGAHRTVREMDIITLITNRVQSQYDISMLQNELIMDLYIICIVVMYCDEPKINKHTKDMETNKKARRALSFQES